MTDDRSCLPHASARALDRLERDGWRVTVHNDGLHLRVHATHGSVNYWPTTGTMQPDGGEVHHDVNVDLLIYFLERRGSAAQNGSD